MAADAAANPASAMPAPGTIRGEIPPQRWIPDERDGFIAWLRAEFAAANAMIDALCQHLQLVAGSPGEYDLVLACIQQRRFSWNPVLHMQHYYSVGEVLLALQQVGMAKMDKMAPPPLPPPPPHSGKVSEFQGSNAHIRQSEIDRQREMFGEVPSSKVLQEQDEALSGKASSTLCRAEEASSKSSLPAAQAPAPAPAPPPKFVVGLEDVQGQQVNVLEGLELYENAADGNATAQLLTLVSQSNITKAGGGRKRSSSSIQFGTIPSEIIAEEQDFDLSPPVPRERIVPEGGVPPPLSDFLLETVPELRNIPSEQRPNSCSISVLEPGDFLLLRAYHSFRQPVYMISLSEISLTFGRDLFLSAPDRNLGIRSAGRLFSLTLPPGSLLVLKGNSIELVQCVASPSRSRQVLLAFGRLKTPPPSQSTQIPQDSASNPDAGRWLPGTGVFLPANGVATHDTPVQSNGFQRSRQPPAP